MTLTKTLNSDPGAHVTLVAPEGITFRGVMIDNQCGSALYVRLGQTPGTAGALWRIPAQRVASRPLPEAVAVTVTVDPAGVAPAAGDWIAVSATDAEVPATHAAV